MIFFIRLADVGTSLSYDHHIHNHNLCYDSILESVFDKHSNCYESILDYSIDFIQGDNTYKIARNQLFIFFLHMYHLYDIVYFARKKRDFNMSQ